MLLKICDIFNTFCQSLLFTLIYNNITYPANRLSKIKSFVLTLSIFAVIIAFTYSNINIPLANFIMAVLILVLLILFSKNSILDASIAFSIAYSIISLSLYFLSILYQNVLAKLNLNISQSLQIVIFIYFPMCIIYLGAYLTRKYIFNAALYLKTLKYSLAFIIVIDFALIFLDTLHMQWTTESMSIIFKSILYLLALIVFIFINIYFAKIYDKSKEIDMLNMALNDKITELRKIKHDYGSEISCLYGLYQLGKTDKLGELLKNIIEKNQSINTAVNVGSNTNPLVASVLHSATSEGINVIVFDSGNYDNISITDNEFIKVLSNIIKNSIDALKNTENPMIKYKSYNSYNSIIITIVNNGPQISKDILAKIFKPGFSTKGNMNGDRGYGLSIVNDIVGRCNGKISIDSNSQYTEFKIELPLKTS